MNRLAKILAPVFLPPFCLLACLRPLPSIAATPPKLNSPQPLTAELANEISPSLSPDQRWLVYTSNQTGNYDLWAKPVKGGVARPLTNHPADDCDPLWDRKRNRIAFVSCRDDPEGDIFIARVDEKGGRLVVTQLKPVISDPGPQRFPCFSRDGRYLAYQDGQGGETRIWLYDLSRKRKITLTDSGYFYPRFSPTDDRILCLRAASDDAPTGAICIIQPGNLNEPTPEITTVYEGVFPAATPCWSPDGSSFVAALTHRDLDGDGRLTATDGLNLYRFDVHDGGFSYRLLSLWKSDELAPFWGRDGFLYYSSAKRGSFDIWKLSAEGPIPRATTGAEALHFATSLWRSKEAADDGSGIQSIEAALLALERTRLDFPEDSNSAAQSLLESSKALAQAGIISEAQGFLKRLARQYSQQKSVLAEAEIDYQAQVHHVRFSGEKIYIDDPASLIANLGDIIRRYSEQKKAIARCHYLSAAAWIRLEAFERAREELDNVIADFADTGIWAAEALLLRTQVYRQQGNADAALKDYLQVITRYGDYEDPAKKALGAVLAMPTSEERGLTALETLRRRFQDVPAVSATAQKAIADRLLSAGQENAALAAYQLLKNYEELLQNPQVREAFAAGLLAAARIEAARGSFQAAQIEFAALEEKLTAVGDADLLREVNLAHVEMLAQAGQEGLKTGDFESALERFDQALKLAPDDCRFHRGKIAASVALGGESQLVAEYRQKVSQETDNPTAQFALGFSLSLAGAKDRKYLQEAGRHLEAAIALKPDLADAYLALGYNYGLLEKTANPGWDEVQGFERAIEILQLGLTVNDEQKDPKMEAALLLNLANSYYELGEFGYAKALEIYEQRLAMDSTFASEPQAAQIRERMGHAAAILGRSEMASENYLLSWEGYQRSGDAAGAERILLRQSEQRQAVGQPQEAFDYLSRAVDSAQNRHEPVPPLWKINLANLALQSGNPADASHWASEAVTQLEVSNSKETHGYKNPLVLKIFGLRLPIWNFGFLGTGRPAAVLGFSRQEELSLAYSIQQEAALQEQDLVRALEFCGKRWELAQSRKDKESQAALWSELGSLYYRLGENDLSRKCYSCSFELCREANLRRGRAAALISLGRLALVSERGAGRMVGNDEKAPLSIRIGADLNRQLPSAQEPYESVDDLRSAIRAELETTQKEVGGWSSEKAQFADIYAQLCQKFSSVRVDSTAEMRLEGLRLQGESLAALQTTVQDAQRSGDLREEIAMRLRLSDFWWEENSLDRSAGELAAAKRRAEGGGSDEILWRVYWRLGRLAMRAKSAPQDADAYGVIRSRLPGEWFEMSEELWHDAGPKDQEEFGQSSYWGEAKQMLELSLEDAIVEKDHDRLLQQAQKAAAWQIGRDLLQAGKLKTMQVFGQDGQRPPWYFLDALPDQELQDRLSEGELLLQVMRAGKDCFLLAVGTDRTTLIRLAGAEAFQSLANSVIATVDLGEEWMRISSELYGVSLAMLETQWRNVRRIYLVTPPELERLPWEWIWTGQVFLRDRFEICRLPCPQFLRLHERGQASKTRKNIAIGLAETPPGFLPPARLDSASILEALQEADVALIRCPSDRRQTSLFNPMIAGQERTWRFRDLAGLNCKGSALIFQGRFSSEATFAAIGLAAGYASVIFLPSELDDSHLQTLLGGFNQQFGNWQTPRAFLWALDAWEKAGIPGRVLDDIRFYGGETSE